MRHLSNISCDKFSQFRFITHDECFFVTFHYMHSVVEYEFRETLSLSMGLIFKSWFLCFDPGPHHLFSKGVGFNDLLFAAQWSTTLQISGLMYIFFTNLLIQYDMIFSFTNVIDSMNKLFYIFVHNHLLFIQMFSYGRREGNRYVQYFIMI